MLISLALSAMFLLAGTAAGASDAQSVLETVRAKQAERWASVENYTVTLSVRDAGGLETPIYYEKMEVGGQPVFRVVPPTEYMREVSERAGFPPLDADALEQMAQGYGMIGDALATGGGDMPPMDVRGMTGDMAAFLRAGASYEENDGRADAKGAVEDMAEFASRARLVGTEGARASSEQPDLMHDAYLIVADGLSDIELEQPEGDARFTLGKISLWIDTEHYVPMRLLMEGEVEVKGKKTPLKIEKQDLDYRQTGPLYESHEQVYRLSGLMSGMSEKDRKEMLKAQAELEKAQKDIQKMPKEQQAMVMKMMGSQMEKLERMTAGDEITSITDVVSIAINEGPPAPYGLGDLTLGGPAAAAYPGALTYAGQFEDGRAQLSIAARLPGSAQASIGLIGESSFPQSGTISIIDASGSVELEGGTSITIESGSGTISVTERSETRIAGTFTALLVGKESTDSGSNSVQFSASGSFDSGAPVGPYQAPRGSPFPADLFSGE